jgi:hypothetical protein
MKISKIIIYASISLIFIIISFILVVSENVSSIKLTNGKNNIIFNSSNSFYAKDLVKYNPKIEVISYIEENTTIGYVNVFSGIGENFIIYPGKEYEIIVKEDINLIIPYEK